MFILQIHITHIFRNSVYRFSFEPYIPILSMSPDSAQLKQISGTILNKFAVLQNFLKTKPE